MWHAENIQCNAMLQTCRIARLPSISASAQQELGSSSDAFLLTYPEMPRKRRNFLTRISIRWIETPVQSSD